MHTMLQRHSLHQSIILSLLHLLFPSSSTISLITPYLLHLLFYHSQLWVNSILETISQILLSLIICSALIMFFFFIIPTREVIVSVLFKLHSVSFWAISVYSQDLLLPAQGSSLAGFGGPSEVLSIIVSLTACKANALICALLLFLSLKDCIN